MRELRVGLCPGCESGPADVIRGCGLRTLPVAQRGEGASSQWDPLGRDLFQRHPPARVLEHKAIIPYISLLYVLCKS